MLLGSRRRIAQPPLWLRIFKADELGFLSLYGRPNADETFGILFVVRQTCIEHPTYNKLLRTPLAVLLRERGRHSVWIPAKSDQFVQHFQHTRGAVLLRRDRHERVTSG